jgi:hypothetical protein
MPKQLQGLRKRTGSIQYLADGKKVQQGPIEVGDSVQLVHENGAFVTVRVDGLQEEGTFIGTVTQMSAAAPGISVNDQIVDNEAYVFVVIRKSKAFD